MKKYYPVSFPIDDIDYTLNLTDSNLSTLANKLNESINHANPLEFFHFDALFEIQDLLNKLGVTPKIENFYKTDLSERIQFLQSVSLANMASNTDRDPDWESKLPDDVKAGLADFKQALVSPVPVVDPES